MNKPAIPYNSYEPPTALLNIAVFVCIYETKKGERNMHKFFKLTGVSMLAVAAASNANAAGYTCEELIEYTSCNTGYYLNSGDCIEGTTCGAGNYLKSSCKEDYRYGTGWCKTWDVWESGHTAESCQEKCDEAGEDGCQFFGEGCVFTDAIYGDAEGVSASDFDASANKVCTPCATGTYQPSALTLYSAPSCRRHFSFRPL